MKITKQLLSVVMLTSAFGSQAVAQVGGQSPLETLQDQVARQQAVIDQQAQILAEQQSAIDDLKDLTSSTPAPVAAGYDGGFIIADNGEDLNTKKSKFKMKIGSWGQFRHNFFDSDGPNLDQNDLDLERLRLVFNGHAFNSSFEYFFQLDADSDANETVDMLDYYVTYDFGKDVLGGKAKRLRVRFGKWKIGFNRAREESGTRMQFSDRSMASVLFDFDRSLGIGLLGEIGNFDWQATVANGIDTGGFRPSRAGQLDRNVAVATRMNWLLTGDWGKDGHADLQWRTKPAVRVGSGFTYSRRDIEATREFTFPRVIDTGATLDTVLPAGVTAYDQFMYAADLNVKFRGVSFIFEYYARQFTNVAGASVPSLLDHGYWAEAGIFVVPELVQLIARHSRTVGDSGTLGLSDTSADEVAGGFVIYPRGHNLKVTFDVTHLNGAPVSDSALNIRPGDIGWLYRTTLQWKF